MQPFVKLLWIILAWFACGWTYAQDEALVTPQDFTVEAKAAQVKHAPILVLFMSSNCSYCERVLREFLLPMQLNAEYRNKVIMRQVEIGNDTPLKDFAGRPTTQAQFAMRYRVQIVPTVMLFDAHGNVLATPLIGLTTPDFYGGYLDQAIDEAVSKVRLKKLAKY